MDKEEEFDGWYCAACKEQHPASTPLRTATTGDLYCDKWVQMTEKLLEAEVTAYLCALAGTDKEEGMAELRDAVQQIAEVQATGCPGVGGYRQYAKEHGFSHIEVYNWTSSAGDWTFIVSEDGYEWQILSQTNNWPRAGFSYCLDEEETFYGTAEEAMDEITAMYGG